MNIRQIFEVISGAILFGLLGLVIAIYYPFLSNNKSFCSINDLCWDGTRNMYLVYGILFGSFIGVLFALLSKLNKNVKS
jgi:hypothetical protein